MAALKRLPRLDPRVWDEQGVSRESGDQRRLPFKGAQSKRAGELGELLTTKMDEKYGSYDSAIHDAPIKRVQFKNVHGIQAGVRADIVERKIHEVAKSDELEAPTMARYKGKTYLIDGNHTLTALKLGGVKAIEAVVVQL